MAKQDQRLPTNVPGPFFVDASCIDCDTCRWMAPTLFDRIDTQARVFKQPQTAEEELLAGQALVSCPTASIGKIGPLPMAAIQKSLPHLIHQEGEHSIYHCGYHSKKSFGAASYLWVGPHGNTLIDSPRFAAPLVKQLEALGGVDQILLTHADDGADHASFHKHFQAPRVLHQDDQDRSTANVETLLHGICPVDLQADLVAIPTPGHTQGSVVFLAAGKFLFSGDHVAWSDTFQRVHAFSNACWFDWEEQIRSMERLNTYSFSWILPGHGRRCHFPPDQMHHRLEECIEWMKSV